MSRLGKYEAKDFISQTQLKDRINELGQQITKDYANEELVMLGVLKGSFIFLADLARAIDLPIEIEMIGLSSYLNGVKSSGKVNITTELTCSLKDKHVLIVEDIFDTGLTMEFLLKHLAKYEAKSLKICCLLKKQIKNQADIKIDYCGFEIPDEFVIGYGLDVAEKLRNLPMISILQH